MVVRNSEIADIFYELADFLEIEAANQFRVRAYRTAARNIESLPQNVAEMVDKGEDLTGLPGIGKDLAAKLAEIVKSGRLPQLEDIKQRLPAGLIDLLRIGEVGPRRVKMLHQNLGITGIEDLEKAAREQQVRKLPGFGPKAEEKILEQINRVRGMSPGEKRLRLPAVEQIAQSLVEVLVEISGVKRIDLAGSYRRKQETVGDLDILVACENPSEVMDRFVSYGGAIQVLERGATRSSIMLRSGFHVDVRVVPDESFGAALLYFTGSKAHSIALRKMGMKSNLKINEYGVFSGGDRVAGATEQEVYAQVGLPYIEPELRENRGEIEAALRDGLPHLITLEDIRGDLHIHTSATEGRATLKEMAVAARERGYQYIAVTDHSRRLAMTRGLNEDRLSEQIKEIDELNQTFSDFLVLKGIEVDVYEDGSLDLSPQILEKLDLVVCSIHHKFDLPGEKQTQRIIRALRHPYFIVLAHPTGRIIGEREPYEVDMEAIIRAARENGCALELNSQTDRLDLADIYCKMAKEMGVKIAISSDAHSLSELDLMRYGITQARRGWLEKPDVLNARSLEEIMEIFRQNRPASSPARTSGP
ncbi:MAG: DNA polymerase/3'-5' exonuclease PolX [Dehalococcoidia bacterium]|nr:DNA polymerase/3'-5' exonuclease PolX [Dehalococcoidia bacterium]